MSYANLVMYGRTLPSYNRDKDKKKTGMEQQEVIKADDPKNRDKVRAILESYD